MKPTSKEIIWTLICGVIVIVLAVGFCAAMGGAG